MDVIVGGGVVGLSIAWRLARQGREVVVVDPSPARGASYAAAGMLAPISEVAYTEEPLLRLGVASLRRWPAFAAALAADAGLTTPGSDGPATTLTAQSDRSVSAPRTTTTPNTHAGQSGSAVPAEGTLPTSTHVVTPHGGTGRTSSAAPPASTHVVTPHGETGHAGSAPTGAGPAAASAVPGDGRFPAFDPSSAGGRRPSAGGEDGRAAASPWGGSGNPVRGANGWRPRAPGWICGTTGRSTSRSGPTTWRCSASRPGSWRSWGCRSSA
ncbi:FAD-dependent oxidoreductase [Nonomuraea ferruginea]